MTHQRVRYSLDGVSSVAQSSNLSALASEGVPASFLGRFTPAPDLAVILAFGMPYVRFGVGLMSENICVEPATGRVVSVTGFPGRSSEPKVELVNTSLKAFTAIAETALDCLPFIPSTIDREDVDAMFDARERAQAMLREIVLLHDPDADGKDLFWPTFIDDVGIGDFDDDEPAQSSVAPDGSSSLAPPSSPSSAPRVNAGIGPAPESDDGDDKDSQ